VALDLHALPADYLEFLRERHLGSLTTLRPDGSPHVVAVGFVYDPSERVVRVITGAGSRKARNLAGGGRAAVCQVDGPRWATLEGPARVAGAADAVARGVAAYAARYRQPRVNLSRVVIEIAVDRAMGRG
jgi:PPOX class probable F420-dependent enzyme